MKKEKILTVLSLSFSMLVILFLFGCQTRGPRASLNVDVAYEEGMNADRIRVSRPFWTEPETFGWLELHHFLTDKWKPGNRVSTVAWLVEYDERTKERRETKYWTSPHMWKAALEDIRYSEGDFMLLLNRHSSIVLERGVLYHISPGNKMTDSSQTERHHPLDFAFGWYLSIETLWEQTGFHENGIPKTGPTGVTLRLFDVKKKEIIKNTAIREEALLTYGIEARLITPEIVFFCLPRIERFEGRSFRTFKFWLYRIPERELVPYGTVRVEARNYLGWDVSPSGEYFALGAVGIPFEPETRPPLPTIIWRKKTDGSIDEAPQWEEFSRLPRGYDPVFSPDGRRLVMDTSSSFRMTGRGVNRYFEDDNPLKGFRFYEVEKER